MGDKQPGQDGPAEEALPQADALRAEIERLGNLPESDLQTWRNYVRSNRRVLAAVRLMSLAAAILLPKLLQATVHLPGGAGRLFGPLASLAGGIPFHVLLVMLVLLLWGLLPGNRNRPLPGTAAPVKKRTRLVQQMNYWEVEEVPDDRGDKQP